MRAAVPRHLTFATLTSSALAVGLVASSCSPSDPGPPPEPPCVTGLTTSCALQYDPPDFATIQSRIFAQSCATGGASCHASEGKKGGLSLADADGAYAMLLGAGGARARVTPGDPSCSILMKRLTSSDPTYHMPPGSISLSAGELCTITTWIARGAKR